jgi:hypothetical protein
MDAEHGHISRGAATAAVVRAAMWLAIPSAAAILLWNHVFVNLWAGHGFYAGDRPNALIAFVLLAASLETTFVNICAALGLYAVSGRLLLVKSLLAIGMGCIGARVFGVGGLLAAPLVAGAITTWWALPMAIGGHSAWSSERWYGLLIDALKGCAAAGFAAGLATRVNVGDASALAAAGLVFTLVYAACLLCLSVDLRVLVIRLMGMNGGRSSWLR